MSDLVRTPEDRFCHDEAKNLLHTELSRSENSVHSETAGVTGFVPL